MIKECYDSGDTAFMLYATLAVFLMTPAAAMLQAGALRRKNALSMLMEVFVGAMAISIVWVAFGFSLAFGRSWIGVVGDPVSYPFLAQLTENGCLPEAPRIPALLFVAFEMQFATLTPLVLSAAWAERIRFEGAVVAACVWLLVVYAPIAHWFWSHGGFLKELGALDFAGGFVVHGSSGVGGLVAAVVLSPRKSRVGHAHDSMSVFWGTSLTLACWYCFNGASGFAATGQAARALLTTHLAASSSVLVSLLLHRWETGAWSFSAAMSGVIVGAGSVTAGSGFIEPYVGVLLGALAAVSARAAGKLVRRLGVDDPLDCFAAQAVPGMLGGIGIAFFGTSDAPQVGVLYADGEDVKGAWRLLGVQLLALICTCLYSCLGSFLVFYSLRRLGWAEISAEQERLGLDISQFESAAYDLDANGQPTVDVDDTALGKRMRDAARAGNLPALRRVLAAATSTDLQDFEGRTALFLAAANGHLDATRLLLSDPLAPLNLPDRYGTTPLSIAIRKGHLTVANLLRIHGATMGAASAPLTVALQWCAANDVPQGILACVDLGVAIDAPMWDGKSALHVAILCRAEKATLTLLRLGASLDTKDIFQQSPRSLSPSAPVSIHRILARFAALRTTSTITSTPIPNAASPTTPSTSILSPRARIKSSTLLTPASHLAITHPSTPPPTIDHSFSLQFPLLQDPATDSASEHDVESPVPESQEVERDHVGETTFLPVHSVHSRLSSRWKKLKVTATSLAALTPKGGMGDGGEDEEEKEKTESGTDSKGSRGSGGGEGEGEGEGEGGEEGEEEEGEEGAQIRKSREEKEEEERSILDSTTAEETFEAAGRGDLDALRRLARRGAPVEMARDEVGSSPLHVAARNNSVAVVRWLLLRRDADPHLRDKCGRSPMLEAATHRAWESATVLLGFYEMQLASPQVGAFVAEMVRRAHIDLAMGLCEWIGAGTALPYATILALRTLATAKRHSTTQSPASLFAYKDPLQRSIAHAICHASKTHPPLLDAIQDAIGPLLSTADAQGNTPDMYK